MSLRIALIGGGYFGRMQASAWQRLDGVNLVAIIDSDPNCRNILEETFPNIPVLDDFNKVDLKDIDLVDIATPPKTHLELIKHFIGNVETIICQKPFCDNYENAKSAVQFAAQNSTKLIVHENFRFMPWYREIKKILQSGKMGEIRQACFKMRPGDGIGLQAYMERQPYFREMERFLIHETGIHWIDVFRYLFGAPSEIFAELWQSNSSIKGEDSALLLMNFKEGVRAVLDANRTLDHVADNHRLTMGEFYIEGSDASLHLNGLGKIYFRKFGSNKDEETPYAFEDRDFGGDCIFHFQNHVVSHLQNRTKIETLAKDYLKNIELEELAYQSAEHGKKLKVLHE